MKWKVGDLCPDGQGAEEEVEALVRPAIRCMSCISRRQYWGHLDVSGSRQRVQVSRKMLFVRRNKEYVQVTDN